MADAPLRYVVLHHTGHDQPHYDLMLEQAEDARLLSVRLPTWPPTDGMPIEWTPPHRRIYLDYEGPVSHNRGHVRRVASGTYERHATTDDAVVRFEGVPGTWRLRDDVIERTGSRD